MLWRYAGAAALGITLLAVSPLSNNAASAVEGDEMPPNFKVAFIGDQGIGAGARALLHTIKAEGAQMVLHQGDFDYGDDPDAWDGMINDILGPDFPYFASIGNHDVLAWPGYQQKLLERLNRVDGAHCTGELGVKAVCSYRGLFFLLSGAGTMDTGHEAYIREQLANDDSLWKVCSWHKNQRLMQVGGKEDEVGWGPYQACREAGAIIATGHEHSYSRTHLMDNFETQGIASTSGILRVEKGKTFAFVAGLGGRSIRSEDPELASNPWWASIYTATQGANFGALFCSFNKDGVANLAHCYFKDVDGLIPDEFHIELDTTPPQVEAALLPVGEVSDNEGLFQVGFSCSDTRDPHPEIRSASINEIDVENGQLVKLELSNGPQEAKQYDGVLKIEGWAFLLEVRCHDASGNVGTTSAAPEFGTEDDQDGDWNRNKHKRRPSGRR